MARKATLRIEAKLGNPVEPISIHVCTDERLIAIVSLADFENACEALNRIRHDNFVKLEAEGDLRRA